MTQSYQIHTEICGPWKNYVHILEDCATKQAIVFDPAWDAKRILDRLAERQLTLSAIWLTHAHHDHVNAIFEVLEKFPVPVYLSEVEVNFLKDQQIKSPFGTIPKDTLSICDQDILTVGKTQVKVIHTPGHSPGSSCFLLTDDMITGDTLFIDGCGRTDLLGSNPRHLYASLQKIIHSIPHHVELHPGHDYGATATATLAQQLQTNPYLLRVSEAEFVDYREHH